MRLNRLTCTVACFVALGLVAALPAAAAPPQGRKTPAPKRWVQDEVVVVYKDATSPSERADVREGSGVARVAAAGAPRSEVVEIPEGESVTDVAAELEQQPEVAYAEPNYLLHATSVPNDPWFTHLWALQSGPGVDIDAPEAWEFTTGSRSVKVAILDTGVAQTHPDLTANIGTGGWDFFDNDSDPSDPHGHGTHVAGTVGATGDNGVGISGVAWKTSLMPLRVLGAEGVGSTATISNAIAHARTEGARIVNLSLGGPDYSRMLSDTISASPGVLFVVAAGNEAADNDSLPLYPCNLPFANVVCVASHDSTGAVSHFSNYGSTSVDLAAPGRSVLSAVPNGYAFYSGTSMAAPHVSGAAALLWSLDPQARVAKVREALLSGVTQQASLAGKTVTGGRLNVYNSMLHLRPDLIAPETPAEPTLDSESTTEPAPQPTASPLPEAPAPDTSIPEPTEPDPTFVDHARSISFRLGSSLVARGKVTVTDGFTACSDGVVVKIKRNGWTVIRTRTNDDGSFRVRLPNKSGRYKATLSASSPTATDSCMAAVSAIRAYSR